MKSSMSHSAGETAGLGCSSQCVPGKLTYWNLRDNSKISCICTYNWLQHSNWGHIVATIFSAQTIGATEVQPLVWPVQLWLDHFSTDWSFFTRIASKPHSRRGLAHDLCSSQDYYLFHVFAKLASVFRCTVSTINKPHQLLSFLFQNGHLERRILCTVRFKQVGSLPGLGCITESLIAEQNPTNTKYTEKLRKHFLGDSW